MTEVLELLQGYSEMLNYLFVGIQRVCKKSEIKPSTSVTSRDFLWPVLLLGPQSLSL